MCTFSTSDRLAHVQRAETGDIGLAPPFSLCMLKTRPLLIFISSIDKAQWYWLQSSSTTPQWTPVAHPCVVMSNEYNQKEFFLKEGWSPHHVQQHCRTCISNFVQIWSLEGACLSFRLPLLVPKYSLGRFGSKLLGNQRVQFAGNCWNVCIVSL